MKWLVFLILFFPCFVCAIEAELDCPRSVAVDEEFPCYVVVEDAEGVYDLKIEIQDDGKTIAKIFNPSEKKWQSTYYYLKEFVEDSKKNEVSLIIEKEGKFEGNLILRKGSKREFFGFKIEATGSRAKNSSDDFAEIKTNSSDDFSLKEKEIILNEREVILLNDVGTQERELVYESKSYRVINYLPYVFSLVLIFIIVVLIWDKF